MTLRAQWQKEVRDFRTGLSFSKWKRLQSLNEPEDNSILAEAARITQGDRRASYGVPLDNHSCTAELWTAWLRRRYGAAVPALTAEDVCLMMVMQKCAREANTPKRDNLVDIAGYAANAQMCMDERAARIFTSKP